MSKTNGFTLIELLLATAIGAILIAAMSGVVGQGLAAYTVAHQTNDLNQQARFAMEQMVRSVSQSRQLLLPLANNPATDWDEHIREETVPPTIPTDSSAGYSAVLAFALPESFDLDGDGTPDADDDGDGLIDEDFRPNRTFSQDPGIYLIDDDGDGLVDEGDPGSDDETATANDDPIDGIDNDGDGSVDEDPAADMNGDGCPGECGVDDDGDGTVDEGNVDDDDEDGQTNEDSINPMVFYLNNGTLMQRTPVPWDENGTSGVTGRDFIEEPVAENVTRLRIERVLRGSERYDLVDITLELTSPVTGEMVSLNTRVRVGGGL